jgi:hypothetical protein
MSNTRRSTFAVNERYLTRDAIDLTGTAPDPRLVALAQRMDRMESLIVKIAQGTDCDCSGAGDDDDDNETNPDDVSEGDDGSDTAGSNAADTRVATTTSKDEITAGGDLASNRLDPKSPSETTKRADLGPDYTALTGDARQHRANRFYRTLESQTNKIIGSINGKNHLAYRRP